MEKLKKILYLIIITMFLTTNCSDKKSIVKEPPSILNLIKISETELEVRIIIDKKTSSTELIVVLLQEKEFEQNPFNNIKSENLISYVENNGGKSSTLFLVENDTESLKATRFNNLFKNKTYWIAFSTKKSEIFYQKIKI